jgi:ribulose-phosphate 3-epimerase
MKSHLIAPSLLAANFAHLAEAVRIIEESEADWHHIDVMDGRFVPNISYGFPILKSIQPLCRKPMDVHLMIVEPERYIDRFREVGADIISVHLEACPHLHRTLQQIRETGAKAGVALNPHSPVDLLDEVLEEVDLVCLMSVNPGFGGQKFIYRTLNKVEQLREKLIVRNLPAQIEVDGGIGLQNAQRILQAGADVLVAGSSVFGAKDPRNVIHQLKDMGHEVDRFV